MTYLGQLLWPNPCHWSVRRPGKSCLGLPRALCMKDLISLLNRRGSVDLNSKTSQEDTSCECAKGATVRPPSSLFCFAGAES